MTGLTLDRIASFDGHGAAASHMRVSRDISRRSFIRAVMKGGCALGLGVIGLLGPARHAYAGHPDDDMAPNCNNNAGGSANDGCVGCNPQRTFCCCQNGWHRHGDGTHSLRPNQCDDPVTGHDYDGWYWTETSCCPGCLRNQKWRCHDGYRNSEPTVCKVRVAYTTTGCPDPCPN